MQLVLRRSQRPALIGSKVVFTLEFRAQLSADELGRVNKYKLGGCVLYASQEITGGSGLLGLASRAAYKAMTITVTVDTLVHGQTIECKEVLELLGVEEQIKASAENFAALLAASTHFGGEEVLEYAAG